MKEKNNESILLVACHTNDKVKAAVLEIAKLLNRFGVKPLGFERKGVEARPALLAGLTENDFTTKSIEIDLIPVNEIKNHQFKCVLTVGGDGTFLTGAEYARDYDVPIIGINMGDVGFLTDSNGANLTEIIRNIAEGNYSVQERITLAVDIEKEGMIASSWALNEVSLLNPTLSGVLEILLKVDGYEVSSYGCDGMLVSTPTGSTAYALSAGGPIVWPDLDAIVLVPSNAHAIFKEPMVISGSSKVEILTAKSRNSSQVNCDGKRIFELPSEGKITVYKSKRNVKVAQIESGSFAETLVKKFNLPVKGWKNS